MKERNLNLDILRFFAVMLVLGRHAPVCPKEVSLVLHYLSGAWARGGWIGVDLFFTLSGFLVSGLIFREYQKTGEFSAKLFLIRRGLKIYPPFYFLILVTLVFLRFNPGFDLGVENNAIGEVLFLQNYVGGLWSHTWSLAVEEHFYIGFAILSILAVRGFFGAGGKRENAFAFIPKMFVFVAVFCFLERFAIALLVPTFDDKLQMFGTHIRIDSLLFGVLLSYYYHFKSETFIPAIKKHRVSLIIAGLLLLSPAALFGIELFAWVRVVGFTLFYLGSGFLLLGFYSFDVPKNSLTRFVAFLGANSYSVYLWHIPIQIWGVLLLKPYFPEINWYWYIFLYFSLSWTIGVLMAKIIEQPVLRLRDMFFRQNAETPAKTFK